MAPFLGSGSPIKVLECGSGPGAISIAVAKAIAPCGGAVLGVDISPVAVENAQAAVREQGISNVEFRVGDVHRLREVVPAADYDVAFTNAVLLYSGAPGVALAEMARALRPGGVVGLREPVPADDVWHPTPDERLYVRVWQALDKHLAEVSGGSWNRGADLPDLVVQAPELSLIDSGADDEFHGAEAFLAELAWVESFVLADAAGFTAKGWLTRDEVQGFRDYVKSARQCKDGYRRVAYRYVVARKVADPK